MHEEGESCGQAADFVAAHRPRSNITAEGLRHAARSFSPTIACTDGLPPKTVVMLSEGLMQCLAEIGNVWVETTTWPANEQVVHIALIPKPAGGERPIGLFRSIIRVVCKAVAWEGLQ